MGRHKLNKTSEQFGQARANVIYAHDLSGNLTFLNRAGERLLGYSCAEARQLNITEMVAPEMARQVRDQILSQPDGRIGSVYEIEMIAKDGRRVLLEVSTRMVLRKGEPPEMEAIAVPTNRNEAIPKITPHCLDTEFFYSEWRFS